MNFARMLGEFSPPCLSFDKAGRVLEAEYGLRGKLTALAGERDQNFMVTTEDGQSLVLKVSGHAESRESIGFQTAMLDHVAEVAPDLPVPHVIRTKNGRLFAEHTLENGDQHIVWAVSLVSGQPISTADLLQKNNPYALGHLQGRVLRALASFFDPNAQREMPWDICNGIAFADELLAPLDPGLLDVLSPHLRRLQDETLPALQGLRAQVIHNDVHAGNLLADDHGLVHGLIDFGDALHRPVIQELAVSAASLIDGGPPDPHSLLDELTRGFEASYPLWPEERELLLDATLIRSLLCVVLGGHKHRLKPQNAREREIFETSQRGLHTLLTMTKTRNIRTPKNEDLIERRHRVMSPTYRLFYKEPVHIVRGEGAHLWDANGKKYVDCYNNVPSVGHCHPHVLSALSRQAGTLITHTRYLHEEVIRYAERLTATLPDELDTCVLLCTGSEANDLAFRIARTVTGNTGALISEGIYHGNTICVSELSLEAEDRDRYQPHIRPIPLPDTYRGPQDADDPDLGVKLAEGAEPAIAELNQSGQGVAMVLIDGIYDNPGIFTSPPGYLAALSERVRAAGGLVVMDEVQSGLCRLGDNMWGFQDSGIVPDIVTMGKPMGNGFPLSVVVAKRDVMQAFAKKADYFNTFAGSPLAAAVGNAVLDVVESQGLLANVHEVGARLKQGLMALRDKHPIIGDVRGKGFFLGLDLVTDRATKAPAREAAQDVAAGMKERGFLVSVSGALGNVIKIRPPLVFSENSARQLLGAFDAEFSAIADGVD